MWNINIAVAFSESAVSFSVSVLCHIYTINCFRNLQVSKYTQFTLATDL